MELTREYFDKHYEELISFLSKQFDKVATKDELAKLEKKMDERFSETHIKLDFIQADIASVKKDLAALAKRTREDDDSFNKELIKLKTRVNFLEKQIKKFKLKQIA